MTLKDTLQSDLTAAMRARDDVTTRTLRMALAAITKAEVAGKEHVDLDDDAIVGVLASEVRRRHEAAEMYAGAEQAARADAERAEAAVLQRYLPAELSDDELSAVVADEVAAAAANGAEGPKAMGVVIKAVRARVGAAADGARVSAAVKQALGL